MKKILSTLFLAILLLVSSASAQIPWVYPLYPFMDTVTFDKDLKIKELSSAPSHKSGYGRVYVLSANSHLYYKDDSGNATDITAGALGGTTTTLEEGDVAVDGSDIVTLDFAANDFVVGEDPNTEVNIAIDYANGQAATTSAKGFLTDTDWDTFNEKRSVATFYDEGAESGAFTIDWTNGEFQQVTITGVALDITFTEPAAPGRYLLMIIQGDGDDTLDWEHEISPKWPGGVEPTLSTGNADVDFIGFFFDGTTTYYGLFNGNFE